MLWCPSPGKSVRSYLKNKTKSKRTGGRGNGSSVRTFKHGILNSIPTAVTKKKILYADTQFVDLWAPRDYRRQDHWIIPETARGPILFLTFLLTDLCLVIIRMCYKLKKKLKVNLMVTTYVYLFSFLHFLNVSHRNDYKHALQWFLKDKSREPIITKKVLKFN
jgi:hypothetical protein